MIVMWVDVVVAVVVLFVGNGTRYPGSALDLEVGRGELPDEASDCAISVTAHMTELQRKAMTDLTVR